MSFRKVVNLFCLLLVSGCASVQKTLSIDPCYERDWFELGREDGSTGRSDSFKAYVRRCNELKSEGNRSAYENGRQAGLVDFCSPENFYTLGRSGQPWPNVCPVLFSDTLQLSYENGKQSLEIEIEMVEIDRRISRLADQLQNESLSYNDRIAAERDLQKLRRTKTNYGVELDALARAIN